MIAERMRRVLESRRIGVVAAVLGAVLCSPSLFAGLNTEDWVFRFAAQNDEVFKIPWRVNLWGPFGRPSDELVATVVKDAKRVGTLPWLTDDTFHVSLWRPLGSLTHHFDYRLIPHWPVLMHAENLLFYALLVAAAAALYQRIVEPRWAAGLAALFYAADDAHGHAVGWITNRSGVMAAAFGVFALFCHDRFVRDDWRLGVVLTPLALSLGLLSSELALGVAGYFVAHLLLLDRRSLGRRALSSLVWVSPVGLWAAAYRWLGHGAWRSGQYVDPFSHPIAFGRAVLERGSVLVAAQLGFPPSDVYNQVGARAALALTAAAALIVIALGFVLLPLIRAERSVAFFSLGLVLSILPACSAFPQDRLLLLPGVGGMGLVATLLSRLPGVSSFVSPRRRRAALAAGGAFVVAHGVVGPFLLPVRSLTMWHYERRLRRAGDSAFDLVERPDQELVLLGAPDFYFATMLTLTRAARGESLPELALCLNGSLAPLELKRLDPYTIELAPHGGFVPAAFNWIYRDPWRPMKKGSLISFDEFQIRVLEVDARGTPVRAKFRFRKPLGSDKMVWAAFRDGRYVRVTLPEPGQSARLNQRAR